MFNLFSSGCLAQQKKQHCGIHHQGKEYAEHSEAAAENALHAAENAEHKDRSLRLLSAFIEGSSGRHDPVADAVQKRLFPDVACFDPAHQ